MGGKGKRSGRKKRRRRRSRKKGKSHKCGSRKRPAPRALQELGNYGSGDHQADVEQFIFDNKLDDRTVDALMTLGEPQQKAVMGTDGGMNAFMLDGKVNNPSAVVMSRIRKL